jgi:hypothetical protein
LSAKPKEFLQAHNSTSGMAAQARAKEIYRPKQPQLAKGVFFVKPDGYSVTQQY